MFHSGRTVDPVNVHSNTSVEVDQSARYNYRQQQGNENNKNSNLALKNNSYQFQHFPVLVSDSMLTYVPAPTTSSLVATNGGIIKANEFSTSYEHGSKTCNYPFVSDQNAALDPVLNYSSATCSSNSTTTTNTTTTTIPYNGGMKPSSVFSSLHKYGNYREGAQCQPSNLQPTYHCHQLQHQHQVHINNEHNKIRHAHVGVAAGTVYPELRQYRSDAESFMNAAPPLSNALENHVATISDTSVDSSLYQQQYSDATHVYSTCHSNVPTLANIKMSPHMGFHREKVIPLGCPDDDLHLNPLQVLIRSTCLEAFSATTSGLCSRIGGRKGSRKVRAGQVGVRCVFCKHLSSREQANQAACFPSSLDMLYESVRNWQRFHLTKCSHIPKEILSKFGKLQANQEAMRSSGPRRKCKQGIRLYFKSSARAIGLCDLRDGNGIFFADDCHHMMTSREIIGENSQSQDNGMCSAEDSHVLMNAINSPSGIVRSNDQYLVTDFMFLLFSQIKVTKFSRERDNGKPKMYEDGFPGLECRHCANLSGKTGRFFPSSSKGLSGEFLTSWFQIRLVSLTNFLVRRQVYFCCIFSLDEMRILL